MSVRVIEERLKEYVITSQRDELNAIKEIMQEIALSALARADFFKIAAFQGGTCLRVVHKLNRFSEDLDFLLKEPNRNFEWEPFLKSIESELFLYEISCAMIDRSKADSAIKLAFLKDTSFGKVLVLKHPRGKSDQQTLTIKIEIDSNPPAGSNFEEVYVNFPYPFLITVQDLPSLFASKCHALLCRPYVKGRDWYDLVWYVSKKIQPNFVHLQHALEQAGPWKGKKIECTSDWLIQALTDKIPSIDWDIAREDAMHFAASFEQNGLKVWGNDFFYAVLERMKKSF